jgi:hypothetical protein
MEGRDPVGHGVLAWSVLAEGARACACRANQCVDGDGRACSLALLWLHRSRTVLSNFTSVPRKVKNHIDIGRNRTMQRPVYTKASEGSWEPPYNEHMYVYLWP